MPSRRDFLKIAAMAAVGVALPPVPTLRRAAAAPAPAALLQIPGGTLPPSDVPKYMLPLIIPPAMPRKDKVVVRGGKNGEYYEIAVRQFEQQILPPGMPMTTVWSYGSLTHPGTVAEGGSFNYPALTIEAKHQEPVRVKWVNDLVDSSGNYLPHLLPVDPTLHWANPPGGEAMRDMRPTFTETPGPYAGPVPIVTHVHGAHTTEESDGYPEAWYLPAANNIPDGYATTGTFYDYYNDKYNTGWTSGSATFEYPNDQRATTLWYHDHTLGLTRANVYAGPAGFYLLRGGPDDEVLEDKGNQGKKKATLPGPAPSLGDKPGTNYYEIPIAIQDRSFNADGSLFFPETRAFFDEYEGPYVPGTPVAPIWNPEFFGNMMVVNGRTWPYLDVEQRRYRFRFLNGCNSRFLILKMSDGTPFHQIGADGGFLAAPVQLNELLIAPAERADVIVDFGHVPAGTSIILQNIGPDEPFGGGVPGADFEPSDLDSTGQVMQFRVVATKRPDKTTPVNELVLPTIAPLAVGSSRGLSLNEEMYEAEDIPVAALLGTFEGGINTPLLWMSPITENPAVGATEDWTIYNFTEDAHPIHIHLVQFQVVGREPIAGGTSIAGMNGPLPWETGFKDTVIAYPGEITRVRANFDKAGLFVWHCHIIDHEDNEMMRPYHVGPIPADSPAQ